LIGTNKPKTINGRNTAINITCPETFGISGGGRAARNTAVAV
jgi:hypothetical protein